MKLWLLFLVVVLTCLNVQAKSDSAKRKQNRITIDIPELGKVLGKRARTAWSERKFLQFLGIKYGDAPRERRFQPATPVKAWRNVRNAFARRRECPTIEDIPELKKLKKSDVDVENCLLLSVSTRNVTQSNPVMVYLHGEFLYDGATAEASPLYLLEKKIVLVSVQYRLAPFGFISTGSSDIPGNVGVSDVVLALEWIQKNIKYFGGDPNRVTLFGQVGGAAIANVLTYSPKVPENLFHQVIYMSGSAFSPPLTTSDPLTYSKDIATRVGCKNLDTVEEINECLKNATTIRLLEAFSKHAGQNSAKGIGNYGGLHITIDGPDGFLPKHPAELVKEKKLRYYPTIGGAPKNAGTFVLKEIFEDYFKEKIPDDKYNGKAYIEYFIKHANGHDPTGAWMSFALKELFTEDVINNGTYRAMLPGLIDLCGTIAFKNPVLLALQANAEKLPNQTYLYSFNYEGEFNRYMTQQETYVSDLPFDLGVSLTDDNLFLFPWPNHAAFLNKDDEKVAKRMVALFTSFATTGVPTGPGVKEWPSLKDNTGPYLIIDKRTKVGTDYLDEYSATLKDEKKGNSLVAEDLEDKDDYEDEEEPDDESEDESNDADDKNKNEEKGRDESDDISEDDNIDETENEE